MGGPRSMNSLRTHFLGVWVHLVTGLLILFCCFSAQASWARTLKPTDGLETPVSLSGDLAVFHDPSGALTIDDIVSKGANIQFEPIPSMLTEGYRKGAVWVRFSLAAPASSNKWLLEIERPLIEHIALYVSDRSGRFAIPHPSYPGAGGVQDARAYPALFPVSVSSTESAAAGMREALRTVSDADVPPVCGERNEDGVTDRTRAATAPNACAESGPAPRYTTARPYAVFGWIVVSNGVL